MCRLFGLMWCGVDPLNFAYLLFVLEIVRIVFQRFPRLDERPFSKTWWYLLHLAELKTGPRRGRALFSLDHLWSLAIEEQFYLVWPAVLWLLPRKRLPWATLGFAAVALGARLYFGSHGTSPEALYRVTPTHMDGLAMGAFACAALRDFRWRLHRWVKPVFVFGALAFVVLAVRSAGWSDALLRTAGVTFLAIACACIVFRAATAGGGLAYRVFSRSWLRSCGKYSYGMYVWHASMFAFTSTNTARVAMGAGTKFEVPVSSGPRGVRPRGSADLLDLSGTAVPPLETASLSGPTDPRDILGRARGDPISMSRIVRNHTGAMPAGSGRVGLP